MHLAISQIICVIVLLCISQTAQCIFFHTPGKLVWNIIESIGGKHKEIKPVNHYHVHYYPVPIRPPRPPLPHKIKIDVSALHHNLHHHDFPSESWSSIENSFPSYSSPLPLGHSSWDSTRSDPLHDDSTNFQQKSLSWDNNDILEKDHEYKESNPKGILLQVPLKQQIVFYQRPAKEKSSLLSTLLKKIRRINDALFHPEDDEHVEEHDPHPHVSNSLSYSAFKK
ncbi:hypothetical protein TKK_0008706 [Trichogramma kaykai]|uniref:Uncharacterized protein n=1 Tax=Trichogramma kaykai TaxID=54128 RepID=A0ABD2X596_9HYME